MNVLDLFSGIGGFSLGLERAGMKTIAFCEIEEFPRKVLRKHWPNVPIFEDVRELHGSDITDPVDLICGGYPCQPFSCAGKRHGHADDRHLWPEMFRLIREIWPNWIIAENVAGHVTLGLDQVLSDLENENYTWWTVIIPACGVGANQQRNRVWIIANINTERLSQLVGPEEKQAGTRFNWRSLSSYWEKWNPNNSFICRGIDGIPGRVDRIKALGNAVVPQIPEIIGRAIMEVERNK